MSKPQAINHKKNEDDATKTTDRQNIPNQTTRLRFKRTKSEAIFGA